MWWWRIDPAGVVSEVENSCLSPFACARPGPQGYGLSCSKKRGTAPEIADRSMCAKAMLGDTGTWCCDFGVCHGLGRQFGVEISVLAWNEIILRAPGFQPRSRRANVHKNDTWRYNQVVSPDGQLEFILCGNFTGHTYIPGYNAIDLECQ